ncbi:MAG: DegV family protein [Eubacteriaceae bacterium]|jgi:DegV family protein with EDD domain
MSRTILADSSANLSKGYTSKSGAGFATVPLTIRVGDEEFIDDQNLDVNRMIRAFRDFDGAARTACPSPEAWAQAFRNGGDEIIAVTMTGKLSGTYNSAMLARQMVLEESPEKKIHVVNSNSTGGPEELIVRKIDELFGEGKDFDEIVEEVEAYNKTLGVVFTLKNFDNLIKNGRMNKIVGTVASKLKIHVVGDGSPEGELRVLYKPRGETKAYAKMVEEMEKKKDMTDAEVIISHTNNETSAKAIAALIEKKYPIKSIEIKENGGLNSFYAEDEGIIIGF